MKRILFVLPLLVTGCSSGVGGTGSQPTTDGDSTGLKAGLYTGTVRCESTDSYGDSWSDTEQVTVTIGDSGLPIEQGQEIAVGIVSTETLGGITLTEVVTDITASDNGVVVGVDVDTQMDLCTDSCVFAFNGTCDDGGPGADFVGCELGTDCFDCGNTSGNLEGTQSTTYKLYGVERIDFRRSTALAIPGTVFTVTEECQGVLVP